MKNSKNPRRKTTAQPPVEIIRTGVSFTKEIQDMAGIQMKLRGFGGLGNGFSTYIAALIREAHESTLRLYNAEAGPVNAASQKIIEVEIKKARARSDAAGVLCGVFAPAPVRLYGHIEGFAPASRTGARSETQSVSGEPLKNHDPISLP